MTDDSQPTEEPKTNSFSDVGRIQIAMIRAGFVDEVINPPPIREWPEWSSLGDPEE